MDLNLGANGPRTLRGVGFSGAPGPAEGARRPKAAQKPPAVLSRRKEVRVRESKVDPRTHTGARSGQEFEADPAAATRTTSGGPTKS